MKLCAHANKALRSFNMYLNVRPPPLRAPWPFSLFFPSRAPPEVHSPIPSPSQPTRGRTNDSSAVSGSPGRRGTTIPPIPPSTNPRGELIFTSRVDKHFKESYERYRAAFEKRRDERVMAEASTTTKLWNWLPSALGGKATGARKSIGHDGERWEGWGPWGSIAIEFCEPFEKYHPNRCRSNRYRTITRPCICNTSTLSIELHHYCLIPNMHTSSKLRALQ